MSKTAALLAGGFGFLGLETALIMADMPQWAWLPAFPAGFLLGMAHVVSRNHPSTAETKP